MAERSAAPAVFMAAYTNYRTDGRVRHEAQALVDAGYRVTVLACRQPDEPDRETFFGVDVVKVWPPNRRRSRAVYVLDYLTFAFMIFVHLLRRVRHYRLIHINNMPDFLVFAAWVPRLLGTPVIHDVHDLMPELFMEKFGCGERHPMVAVLRRQERWACAFASAVQTVEEGVKDILASRSAEREKIHVLMNLPDDRVFTHRGSPPGKPPGAPFVLVYHGALVHRLGVDIAIEAVAKARTKVPNLRLRIIGLGEERENLVALRDRLGLQENVSFSDGVVPTHEIPALIADADAGVVPLRRSGGTEIMLPTKLIEYATLGIPSITSRNDTIVRYFDDTMVEFVEAEDVDALAAAIVRLHRDPERRAALEREATARFRSVYRWSGHKRRYIGLVERLLAADDRRGCPPHRTRSDQRRGSASVSAARPTPK